MADDSILNCGINRLLQLTPKILDYAKAKSSNSLIKYYLQLLDGGEEDFEAKEVTGGEFLIVYKLEEIDVPVINKFSERNGEAFSTGVLDTIWSIQLVSGRSQV